MTGRGCTSASLRVKRGDTAAPLSDAVMGTRENEAGEGAFRLPAADAQNEHLLLLFWLLPKHVFPWMVRIMCVHMRVYS